jgi:hypothetical protein
MARRRTVDRIASAPHGFARLRGVARPIRLLPSLVSRTEAIGSVALFAWGRLGAARRGVRVTAMEDFLLDDGSGLALVRGNSSELRVAGLERVQPRKIESPTVEMRETLERAGVDVANLFSYSRVVAHEHLLLPGDTVHVYGNAVLEVVPEHSDRDYRSPSQILTVAAPEGWHLLVLPVKNRRR